MRFVVDASVAAGWCLIDEANALTTNTLQRFDQNDAVVPALWWFEVRNVLVMAERRGRITPDGIKSALELLAGLPIELDREPREAALLSLARRHRLTVYDAAYLELAVRERLPLATQDKALAQAAQAESVDLITT